MDTYTALTRRVEHLKLDKIAQALEITKLKRRVKKLEKRNKGRMITDDAKDGQDVDDQENANIQGRTVESQAEIYKIDLDHANKVLSMQEEESESAELQEVVDIVTTAKIITEVVITASTTITAADVPIPVATTAAAPKLTAAPSRRTKGVMIRDPEESTITTSIIIHSEAKELEAELNRTIDWYEVIDHVNKKAKEDKSIKRYQAIKRKPQTEAQARKNMMVYLKNVAGFKMDYFKEEESRALKRINETLAENVAKRQKLNEKVEELKRHLQIVPNEDDDRGLGSIMKFSQRKICYCKAQEFFDDFLLMTLEAMFEKPNIHAQIWKNQRSVHGQAKVKSWKLLESCGVQIITFTTAQLILLVERKYPFIRFTLDQMLNKVRLEVKEESEVSLEFLRFIRQQHQEGAQLE
nr:hypothetical protein [Tanacetum cinerariifolium]GEX18468.1 hypothetical protein [Tanacetum cinerariifolium]